MGTRDRPDWVARQHAKLDSQLRWQPAWGVEAHLCSFPKKAESCSCGHPSCRGRKAESGAGQHLAERQSSWGGTWPCLTREETTSGFLLHEPASTCPHRVQGLGETDCCGRPSRPPSFVQKSDEERAGGIQLGMNRVCSFLSWPLDSRVSEVSQLKPRLAVIAWWLFLAKSRPASAHVESLAEAQHTHLSSARTAGHRALQILPPR